MKSRWLVGRTSRRDLREVRPRPKARPRANEIDPRPSTAGMRMLENDDDAHRETPRAHRCDPVVAWKPTAGTSFRGRQASPVWTRDRKCLSEGGYSPPPPPSLLGAHAPVARRSHRTNRGPWALFSHPGATGKAGDIWVEAYAMMLPLSSKSPPH